MKKYVITLLFIFVLFLAITPKIYAASVSIAITGPTTANAGDTITVTLSLNADYNISGYGLSEGLLYCTGSFSFDNNLTYISDELIYGKSGITQEGIITTGVYAYSVAPMRDPTSTTRIGGSLVRVTFKINNDVADNTVLSFRVQPSITRLRQEQNSGIESYYDINATGGTLSVKVSNPNSELSDVPNNSENNSTQDKPSNSNSNNNGSGTLSVIEKSSNNYLKSLIIENYQLDQDFDKENFEYTIIVSSEINEISINAVAEDSKSTIEIIGDKELIEVNNIVEIKVIAEDGSEKIYTVNIIKMVEEEKVPEEIAENPKSNSTFYIAGAVTVGTITLLGVGFYFYRFHFKKQ